MGRGRPIGSLNGQYSLESNLRGQRKNNDRSKLLRKIRQNGRNEPVLLSQVSKFDSEPSVSLNIVQAPHEKIEQDDQPQIAISFPQENIDLIDQIQETVLFSSDNEHAIDQNSQYRSLLNVFSKNVDNVEEYAALLASFFGSNSTQTAYAVQIERENLFYHKSNFCIRHFLSL